LLVLCERLLLFGRAMRLRLLQEIEGEANTVHSAIRSLGLVAGVTLAAAGLAHAQTTTPTEPAAPVPQTTAPAPGSAPEGDAQNGRQRLRSTLPP
jgi:hypothetical protein